MKTSNYILLAFLTFILLVLVSWHVDSSFHEEEYDRKKEIRTTFYASREELEKDQNSLEKRNDFVLKAKAYFEYNEGSYYDYRRAAQLLNYEFRTFKDTTNLLLAKQWAEKAYEKKPDTSGVNRDLRFSDNREANNINGLILENLGLKEEAKPYFENVKKFDSIEGYKLEEYKNDKGEIIRVRKLIDTTKLFKYEAYKNDKGEVINIRKPMN
jgi:hypothetical protein